MMKKFKLIGAIALVLMVSLNASVLLESNDWENSTEVAHATTNLSPAPIPGPGTVAITFDAREVIYNCPPQAPQNFFRGCVVAPTQVCRRTSCW